jgi:hypothetical protein
MVLAYLEDHPCVRCGYCDPRALDFHHRVADDKEHGVSRLLSKDMPEATIWSEIEKCDVLCSNCHRVYHAEERGWHIDQDRLLELARRLAAR